MNLKQLKALCKATWQEHRVLAAARVAITSGDPDGLPNHHLKVFTRALKSIGLHLHTRQSQHGEYEYVLTHFPSVTPKPPNKTAWTRIIAAAQVLYPDPSFSLDTDLWTAARQGVLITNDDIPESHRPCVQARIQAITREPSAHS